MFINAYNMNASDAELEDPTFPPIYNHVNIDSSNMKSATMRIEDGRYLHSLKSNYKWSTVHVITTLVEDCKTDASLMSSEVFWQENLLLFGKAVRSL